MGASPMTHESRTLANSKGRIPAGFTMAKRYQAQSGGGWQGSGGEPWGGANRDASLADGLQGEARVT